MADFLHAREFLKAGESVKVTIDCICRVMVMDDYNLSCYRRGSPFYCLGGETHTSPVIITVDRSDNWNTVIDLGGRTGSIRHSISYIKQT